ncbi:MAG: Ig-like domain-containing protein [Synergistaceae bacterium]|nr:Ig-like domain-containing protein [Synergistaceae bacterium]
MGNTSMSGKHGWSYLYLIAGPAYNGDLRGDSLLTINVGEFKGNAMIGGCYAYGTRKPNMKGNSSVVINGVKITSLSWGVIGGCAANDSGAEAMVQGSSSVSIYGGTIPVDIYGGPFASSSNVKSSVVSGDASVNIIGDDGLAAITAPVKIFAGADPAKTNSGVGGNAAVNFVNITKTPAEFKGFELNGGKSVTSGDSVLVFNTVKADFSKVTIASFDRVEVDPNSEISGLSKAAFDADIIKLTGNWNNLGNATPLKFTDDASTVEIDTSGALGVKSAGWSSDGKTLVVKCDNTPVAVTTVTLHLEVGKSGKVTAATYAKNEAVQWSSSDTTVAAVDGDGNVTAVKVGLTVVSATGTASETKAGCTVTVEDPASPDPVPTPAPVTTTVVTEKDNPVNADKDVPAEVKPATPVITPATKENTTALAKSADVTENFFTATADGNITVDPVIAKKTVASVMSDDAAVAPKTIVTLPIITATIDSGKVAALAVKTTGAQLGAAANNIVSDITLIKILKDGTGAKFGYTAEPAGYADQSFTLKNAEGNNLAFTDKIDPTATYTLILFVKDNGEFDYDKTMGSVIDPVAMAMNEAKAPKPSGGSSSGCSAGL